MSNTPAVQNTATLVVQQMRDRHEIIQSVLPQELAFGDVIATVGALIRQNPKIAQCTPSSIMASVFASCQAGLSLSPVLQHAYLIPRYNPKKGVHECTFMVGYRGMMELARRSNEIAGIDARVVYEDDEFSIEYGLTPHLRHKPSLRGGNAKMVGAYAVMRYREGYDPQFEFISAHQLNAIRDRSQQGSVWRNPDNFDEMCRKTAVRRLAKWAPMSATRFHQALNMDQRLETASPRLVEEENGSAYIDYVDGDVYDDSSASAPVGEEKKTPRKTRVSIPPPASEAAAPEPAKGDQTSISSAWWFGETFPVDYESFGFTGDVVKYLDAKRALGYAYRPTIENLQAEFVRYGIEKPITAPDMSDAWGKLPEPVRRGMLKS